MRRAVTLSVSILGAGLFAGVLSAQQQSGRVLGIPAGRGVYVESQAGVVNLPASVVLPFYATGWREVLGLGSTKARLDVDGAGAALEIPTAKPTFYMRGYRPGTRLYLVQTTSEQDFRRVRMNQRHYGETTSFQKADLRALRLEPVADDLVSLTPTANLAPGEYLLVSTIESPFRGIRLAYEFSVVVNRAN